MSDLAVIAMAQHPLPLWVVAAFLALLLLTSVIALRRSGSFGSLALLLGLPVLALAAWAVWSFVDHVKLQQQLTEREALNTRALQLNAAAIAPGSVLACLDTAASELAEAACEAALFMKPETTAAATAYVEAKLRLLADGMDYSRRMQGSYDSALTQLQRSLETDRYGFVAHVLATRDGCTADACDALALFGDAGAVKSNINARTFENTVARYAANWPQRKTSPVAEASPPEPSPAASLSPAPVFRPIDFPSAASIPPVSIMTEPAGAPAVPGAAAETNPARRPAASATQPARPR
jgi:hypothetical protein